MLRRPSRRSCWAWMAPVLWMRLGTALSPQPAARSPQPAARSPQPAACTPRTLARLAPTFFLHGRAPAVCNPWLCLRGGVPRGTLLHVRISPKLCCTLLQVATAWLAPVARARVCPSRPEADTLGWAVGDRVALHPFLARGDGTLAQFALVDARAAARVPASVSFEVRGRPPHHLRPRVLTCAGLHRHENVSKPCARAWSLADVCVRSNALVVVSHMRSRNPPYRHVYFPLSCPVRAGGCGHTLCWLDGVEGARQGGLRSLFIPFGNTRSGCPSAACQWAHVGPVNRRPASLPACCLLCLLPTCCACSLALGPAREAPSLSPPVTAVWAALQYSWQGCLGWGPSSPRAPLHRTTE
jgi:hypothetical protein